MTRPEDIPEDVWAAAEDAYVHDEYYEQVEATARAILAERERCINAVKSSIMLHYMSIGTGDSAIGKIINEADSR